MSLDDIKRRFTEEIKLRGYDDQYIDKNEEREILQIAIQQGISLDSARSALVTVCQMNNYVLESVALKQIRDNIEIAMGDDGQIDEKEFSMIVASAKKALNGKRNDNVIKKTVITIMEETGNTKVKTGWFSNWMSAVKAEVKDVKPLG
jgi:hypothetical protein